MAFLAILYLAGGTLVTVGTYFMHVFMVFWDANKARAKRFFLQPTVSEIFRDFLDPLSQYIYGPLVRESGGPEPLLRHMASI